MKQVIIKPLITEKTYKLYKDNRVVTFIVDKKATKKNIAYYFNKIYGINPTSVRVVSSRKENTGLVTKNGRLISRTHNRIKYKKAYINIGENKLEIFENIG